MSKIKIKEIADEYLGSEMKVKNVDYRAAVCYLASRMKRPEIVEAKLQRLVPRRKHVRGKAPGGTTKENVTRLKVVAQDFTDEKGAESVRDTILD